MARRRLAVASSAAHPDLRPDWPVLQSELRDRGVDATSQVWTDPEVPWREFDLVVANGAWDNIHRPEEFLSWAESVEKQTRIVNAVATLRWNLDKRYLAHLAQAGVPTVPTQWLSPGDPPPTLPEGEFVVKPTVSGGGYETARYAEAEHERALRHIDRLHAAGRTVMVQPYQSSVDAAGEMGLIFLGGAYSHAIGKKALLRLGAGAQEELWSNQKITEAEPSRRQLHAAEAALAAAERLLGPTAYARVDLVPLADGTDGVLELELLDPALFFEVTPDPARSAGRFADVLAGIIGGVPPKGRS